MFYQHTVDKFVNKSPLLIYIVELLYEYVDKFILKDKKENIKCGCCRLFTKKE